jgi:hypothetical protein
MRVENERKSHKYTNCMFKGLNLKCNIHTKRLVGGRREREKKTSPRKFRSMVVDVQLK